MSSDPNIFLETARELALQAATEIMALHQQPMAQERKADKSLVTEADLQSDQILRSGLLEAFPGHALLSEETGTQGKVGSEYTWLIDPLDGTKAYAKGIPGFSVMVGLLRSDQPYLGVVVDPLQQITYEAIEGAGAFMTRDGVRQQIHVSSRSDYSEMPLITSTGFPEDALKTLREDLSGPIVDPINSVGIKVGLLVQQIGDIYISHHPVHHWDTCAPQIILEEAGGTFTKLDGTPLEYELESPYSHHALTLASNGTRHEDIVSLIADLNLFK